MIYEILESLNKIKPFETASAHCDVPCGVYDPIPALVSAVTVASMMDSMHNLEAHENNDHSGEKGVEYQNSMTRMISEKERSAEHVKREVRILWGDFFKEQQFSEYPNLNNLCHSIMSTATKCKQTADREIAAKLISQMSELSEIFWKVKGIKTKTVTYHAKPHPQVVFPDL